MHAFLPHECFLALQSKSDMYFSGSQETFSWISSSEIFVFDLFNTCRIGMLLRDLDHLPSGFIPWFYFCCYSYINCNNGMCLLSLAPFSFLRFHLLTSECNSFYYLIASLQILSDRVYLIMGVIFCTISVAFQILR